MPKRLFSFAAVMAFLFALCAANATAQENDAPQNVTDAAPETDADADKALSALHDIVQAALKHNPDALARYRQWAAGRSDAEALAERYSEKHPGGNASVAGQLAKLAKLVDDAERYAEEALANPAFDKNRFHDLVLAALAADSRRHALAVQAVGLVADAWKRADSAVKTRETLLSQYQDEIRKGNINPGTRLAWSLVRVAAADKHFRIVPDSLKFSKDNASIKLEYFGSDVEISLGEKDYKERFRAVVDGYKFRSGWPVLFQKPLAWMHEATASLKAAGVGPEYHSEWEVMEAPEGIVALATPGVSQKREIPLRAFYKDALRNVVHIPTPPDAGLLTGQFREAARRLHVGVMADDAIPQRLRHALEPILEGAYKPIDKRDYFDNDFCRRLIEADYLETQIKNLSPERKAELEAFRAALAKIETGIDRFAIELDDDGMLVAVSKPEIDIHDNVEGGNAEGAGNSGMVERDPETGENLSPWQWRWEKADATLFHSPMPGRSLYAFSVLERYDGLHKSRPKGTPEETQVWHAVKGLAASYRDGAPRAEGDARLWLEAVTMDANGRRDANAGPLGWNFPLYVPVRNDQEDPVLIATLNGVVDSPDFSGLADAEKRQAAQDVWLDKAAAVLSTPGEMALIYQLFFRYCSDSPLPERPNLIGSHRGLSDTHQTVYQSLDRRWVGRLIGDCDDLAEFFQNLASRQGRLSYVMQLPAHAAAGWLEENPEGGYEFIVLQTGPVLRFTADSRVGAVEKAYRHFEDDVGSSHFTPAAVPLLLRFGGDDTRTAFVLSARIYWDREYAEKMIKVQEYWHIHAYSAGIAVMEDMIKTDREVGNLKELASLYEMVGAYGKSAAMRREELAAVEDDPQAYLSTLSDLAQLYIRDRDKEKALESLALMEEKFDDWRQTNPNLYGRSLSFRASWAAALARLDEPERAWAFLEPDVEEAWEQEGKLSDTMLRTLLTLYDRMSIRRDLAGDMELPKDDVDARYRLRTNLSRAFGKGYFKSDDSYNKIHARYFLLGRYGVAVAGRPSGLEKLWADGPYPEKRRDHTKRTEDLDDADWEWFRIMPRLYLAYGLEMLDKDEHPDQYDPAGAKQSLERIPRALEKGMAVGSNVMGRDAQIKGDLVLSFIDHDLAAFRKTMEAVREYDYSSLYDDAALVFGAYAGLVPDAEFGEWIKAFHEFFPKRQHYFKAAYRALDKGHYEHGASLARAAAGYFPDDELMTDEATALQKFARDLRTRLQDRGWDSQQWTLLKFRTQGLAMAQ